MRLATSRTVLAAFILAALLDRTALAQNDIFGQILQGFSQGMQQSQQNQGSYNRNPWGQQNNQFRSSGDWFNQTPKYRYETRPKYEYRYGVESSYDTRTGKTTTDSFRNRVQVGTEQVRVRDGYQVNPNVGNILTDVFNAAGTAAANSNSNNNNNYGNRGGRDGYYPPRQTYPQQQAQPTYVRPQPVAATSRPVTPVKNVVRQQPKQPKSNDGFNLDNHEMNAMSAEFDARQANEASKGAGKVDAAIENELSMLNDAEANKDYQDAVLSGDPEKMKEFQDKHGGKLSDEGQKALDVRIALGEYERDVASGLLTGPGKDQRLDEINDKFAAMGDTPLKKSLGDNISEMDKFNELGKLSELAQDSDNPWDVMMEGTQNAGYPVSFLAEVSGMPLMTDPLIDSSASAAATTVILNPEENGQSVNYNLGPHPYSIGPGQSQRLEKSYVIAFDPGNGGAVKKYTLGTGTYKFVLTNGSWDLKTVKIAVTIDNSQYDGTFNYLVDGKDAVLQSGQAADLTSSLPIIIEFDRGDGGKPARKVLTEGTFVVGVDASQQRLDLFDASASPDTTFVASSGSNSSSSAISTTNKPKSKRADKAKQIQEALARLKAKG